MPASDDAEPRKTETETETGIGASPSEDTLMTVVKLALENVATRVARPEVPASEDFIESLCTLLVARDIEASEAMVRSRIGQRQGYADLADGIFAACARRLGTRWEEDRLSFADVAIAVTELHRLHQRVGRRYVPLIRKADESHAVFATLPRQTHTFGIILAAEAFRQAGWQVDLQLEMLPKEIVDRIRRLRPDAVGLTASKFDPVQPLRLLIGQIQKLPFNVPILLGGAGAADLHGTLQPGTPVQVVHDIDSALRAVQTAG
ncbi:cobalamin B12-binding domain protein [Dinoroseobacter shibae DFL 12 = DSM 16493]|jgi:methanogenic corrinoid protein MtbC1|uniref:Cobalamin B12-binding domain protein n=1 Tax=Dinoroseobacter shibae (strain DSM 16493 / NCIMB 14021 / DFL 12) TaxID=398580 RepID=A8LQX8_DINSH|nr:MULTISPECIES: cobalamin-dependent protein [Dinoroseobacter]ABV92521.1 cobalamin B12-binding domain protein [Dinoroseobacter shibae DFL 12 = DSM 16493]MDD9718217.1 cobalamin-dependent protein [Dinoroseobacter sp. PD6]URF47465.1 cobalamin-dependent protein [Dinoroseobacter shibae]URF51776.1 cobalamin-dependent protein [Dinoroseobacter shibae]